MSTSEKTDPKQDSTSDPTPTDGVTQALPQSPSPFQEGESVVAKFEGQYYIAKLLDILFILFGLVLLFLQGWKTSWDEWVGADRLLKESEENLLKVSQDKKQMADKYANTGRTSRAKMSVSSDISDKKQKNNSTIIYRKRKREHLVVKGKDSESVEKLIKISIPPTLKKQLVDDFELINRMGQLVRLPRTPNVDDIFQKYRHYRGKEEMVSSSVEEVLSGLCVYFNKALPLILLYNKERQQFQEAITENVSPSTLYGAEHLLRLFVKLPSLLFELNIEEDTLMELQQNLLDFLKFLQKNQNVFFLSSYHAPEGSWRSTEKI